MKSLKYFCLIIFQPLAIVNCVFHPSVKGSRASQSQAAASSTGRVRRKVTTLHSASSSHFTQLHPTPGQGVLPTLGTHMDNTPPLLCTAVRASSPRAHVQNVLCMGMEPPHLFCSAGMARSRLELECGGLLHMPGWQLVITHILSLLSNLIIWHIHYEPRFLFRCGLEESANSCTCTTRGTKLPPSVEFQFSSLLYEQKETTHNWCFLCTSSFATQSHY